MTWVPSRAVFAFHLLLVGGEAGRAVREHSTGTTCCIPPRTSWTAEQMLEIYKFVLYHPATSSRTEREENAKELWEAVNLGSKVGPVDMSENAQEHWLADSQQVADSARLAEAFVKQSTQSSFTTEDYWFQQHECLAGVFLERVEDAWLKRWRCDEGNLQVAWLSVLQAENAYSSQEVWADVAHIRSTNLRDTWE